MQYHISVSKDALRFAIRTGRICLGGNARLKIFGKLNCASGKRMKRENRVFFGSIVEAELAGFRPCGHCMREAYREWRSD